MHVLSKGVVVAGVAAALAVPVTGAAALPQSKAAPEGNAVVQWSEYAGEAGIGSRLAPLNNPLHESRMYAMTHVAVHDALNGISRRYEQYAWHGRAVAGASPQAAVATAARDVLVAALRELPEPFSGCSDAAVARVESRTPTPWGSYPTATARPLARAPGGWPRRR